MTIDTDAVVQEALSWVRTPYHHAAKIKGVGVDCAQLLIAVYSKVGAIPDFDPGGYSPEWHLHRSEEVFKLWVEDFAHRLPDGELPKPGDLVLYRFGRCYSHGAIVIEWPRVVHAVRRVGMVLDDDGDSGEYAAPRPRLFYRLKEA